MQFLGIWQQFLRKGIVLVQPQSFSKFYWMKINDSSQVIATAKYPWEPRPESLRKAEGDFGLSWTPGHNQFIY